MSKPLALITGASSGIGETFARKLAAQGYGLILVARREEKLRELAAELSGAEVLVADLATSEGVAAVERAIVARPDLDLLVNNAGFGTQGRFWETALAGQIQMHELHVLATMRLTRAALPEMVKQGQGAVINVSSVAAFGQSPESVSYCATKAWMNSFTVGLRMELKLAKSKVRVQALCPGFTLTEFQDRMGTGRGPVPGYLWMTAEDVVEASLRGLEQGKTIVVPGLKYKLGVRLLKLVRRW